MKSVVELLEIADKSTVVVSKNLAVWFDGTLRAGRGHNATCVWFFDGQFWYHRGDE